MQPAIIVHGGAGNDFSDRIPEFKDGVERAARKGFQVLREGGSALDAVESAVRVLEDDPTFDAGHGSFLNQNMEVEMDAMIMDGVTLSFGAVAGIQRVDNPVSVARLVMEKSPHCFFAGNGAERFARSMGVPMCTMEELVTGSSTFLLKPEDRVFKPHATGDTVGAIAMDQEGHLAVATSTGGTAGKIPGRVGDTPVIGSGGFADNTLGAAAGTGHGEALMKVVFSKTACDLMGNGLSPTCAARTVLEILEKRTGKTQGGIILMNPQGDVGAAFNTEHMVHACFTKDGQFCITI